MCCIFYGCPGVQYIPVGISNFQFSTRNLVSCDILLADSNDNIDTLDGEDVLSSVAALVDVQSVIVIVWNIREFTGVPEICSGVCGIAVEICIMPDIVSQRIIGDSFFFAVIDKCN